MTKKADTWMPLYVGEYLADTTNLNTEQHGAYCLMLMAAWKRGGTLPNDDAQLASITKLSTARWKASRAILTDFFTVTDAGLVHKRVTAERIKAQAISDQKSKSGSTGAAKRWEPDGKSDGEPDGKSIADAMANAMANASQTDAPTRLNSPSPLPTPSELIQGADAPLSPASLPPGPPPELDLGCDPPDEVLSCPIRRLIDLYKSKLPDLPKPRYELWKKSSGAEAMRHRWKWLLSDDATRDDGTRYATTREEAIDWFTRYFETVAESDFLTGRNGRWKGCDLAWLMKFENFQKVIQGNYSRERQAA